MKIDTKTVNKKNDIFKRILTFNVCEFISYVHKYPCTKTVVFFRLTFINDLCIVTTLFCSNQTIKHWKIYTQSVLKKLRNWIKHQQQVSSVNSLVYNRQLYKHNIWYRRFIDKSNVPEICQANDSTCRHSP